MLFFNYRVHIRARKDCRAFFNTPTEILMIQQFPFNFFFRSDKYHEDYGSFIQNP